MRSSPVDHLQENAVDFFQEFDNHAGIFSISVHSVKDSAETNTKHDGEHDDTRKVGGRKGVDNVASDELGKDPIVDCVTKGDVVTSTSALLHERVVEVIQDEVNGRVILVVSGTHEAAIRTFRNEGSRFIARERHVRRTRVGENLLFVLSLHDESTDDTKHAGSHRCEQIQSNGFVSNSRCLSDVHHINHREDDVDENLVVVFKEQRSEIDSTPRDLGMQRERETTYQRENDTLQGSNKQISNKTNPL